MKKILSPNSPWLITGAAGFIGARIVERWNKLGVPLLCVDEHKYFSAREEHRGIDFGKIIGIDQLETVLEKEAPKLSGIIHMGACSSTTEQNWEYLKKNNIEYSKMLWNCAMKNQIPFLYASSAATYGEGELGYDDDHEKMKLLKPLNYYGRSKHEFDLWALEQDQKNERPTFWAGFKFFNVYGFGERHKKSQSSVVLQAFDQIRETGKVKLFKSHRKGIEDGEQKRDFVYVGDLVSTLEYFIKNEVPCGVYNLGSSHARSFLDLVHAVFQSMGKTPHIEFIDMPEILREKYQYFTEAKMKKLQSVGIQRFTPLEEGVQKTVEKLENFYGK